ncbi:TlpA disulfide reductase family protein [Lutibacter sp.]|uniref:TlpA family protein disulfide reductase n=1 Tax=Lutibacter sp. TaxID=1925666 RepID=UPI0025C218D1|nr:TlpA disulfide reductase family protein [Lutibacter sp.]MCF6168122.1 TlpA family protein disulfide reductase [Lutibacter sp.]
MPFKNYFISLSIVFTLFFTSCSTKDPNSFSISGKIHDLNTNYALLSKIKNIQKQTTLFIDTLKINKRGRFNSVYLLEPGIYNLTFDKKTIQLAIDRGQNIEINGNTLDNIRVKGSFDTQLLNDYEAFRIASLNRLVISVRDHIKELKKAGKNESKIADLRELEVENYKKHLNELVTFVKDNMGTSIAVYATSSRWNGENLPFLQSLVSNFEKAHPNIEITQKLKDKLNLLQKTSVGGIIGNIEMLNKDGEIISLNTIKGKYTLVDFWASWCPPCRAESALLNDLYQLYKPKGFDIYGISLDSKRKNWLKAIEKDKRVWAEVSTVEGFDTPVSTEYGITALPTNFLIDSTGKIIAVNIHGKHLKEKIESLFDK